MVEINQLSVDTETICTVLPQYYAVSKVCGGRESGQPTPKYRGEELPAEWSNRTGRVLLASLTLIC